MSTMKSTMCDVSYGGARVMRYNISIVFDGLFDLITITTMKEWSVLMQYRI